MTTQSTFDYKLLDYQRRPEEQITNVPMLIPIGGHYQTRNAVYVVFEHSSDNGIITPLCQKINNKGFGKI